MKKMFAFLLAAVMCISLTACGNDSEGKNDTENTPIVGGWTNTESPEVTKEVKALLEKESMDGRDVEALVRGDAAPPAPEEVPAS